MTNVVTVTGECAVEDLGFVLPHEHLFTDVIQEYRGEGLLNDMEATVEDLRRYVAAGGVSLIDTSTRGTAASWGPRPDWVAEASRRTGVKIVMGCGFYRDPFLKSEWMDPTSVPALADELIHEVEHGFGTTGVRPGIIGEIGANREYISAAEERSFRAAARTHNATGLTITTHAARWPVGIPQLDLLAEEGVAPERVIIGHSDTVPLPDYHLELARRGAWVQFDCIRKGPEWDLQTRVGYVKNLVDNGFADRILISHDVCLTSHLEVRGGGGYTLILREFIPRLRDAGLTDELIEQITVHNPANALVGSR
jgi:predicted metal-dependent phosphotriesterase family hydrolase